MKVGILGNGQWGNALASAARRAGHSVSICERELPSGLDLWLIAVPSAYFRVVVKGAKAAYNKQPILICTKGIELKTNKFMSEILREELPASKGRIGVLSGPQFAAEVANGCPSGATLAGPAAVRAKWRVVFREMFLEETLDTVGTEVSGAGKNAAAIAAGFFSVKAKGENERAMMVARAWDEIADIGISLGAKPRTFIGLCGIGDLFLSATSGTSRNFSAGALIAKGKKPIGTVEGIGAIKGFIQRAKKQGVKTPVLNFMLKQIP